MFPLSQSVRLAYVSALALAVLLLLGTTRSTAQHGFGISTGFRATPALPVIAFPIFQTSGSTIGGGVGGGASGFGGGVAGGGTRISFSSTPSIFTLDLGSFYPNHGQIIGLPPATFTPPLNNLGLILMPNGMPLFPPNLGNLFLSDTSGIPLGILTGLGTGGGVSTGGTVIGGGGIAGGGGVAGGGGMRGIGGGGGMAGGMGGFAGKGMGGFNGRKPL